MSLEKRFRRKVSEPRDGGCTEWLGWKNNSGYGMIKSSSRPYKHLLAHRVSYELHHGDIPEGMDVMHTCDNKVCVNPEHLRVGTRKENMEDMVAKNRQKTSKLTEVDFERIQDMRTHGLTMREIAKQFGVSRPLISLILSGKMTRPRLLANT